MQTVSLLAQLPPVAQQQTETILAWVNARVFLRRYDEGIAPLDKIPVEQSQADWMPHDSDLVHRGMLLHIKGETEKARPVLEAARQRLQQKIAVAPDYAKLHGSLAHVLAYLGDKPGALAAADRSMQPLPETADAFDGPMMTAMAAQTCAIVGESDRALAIVERLLTAPNGLTVPTLRLDPMSDPLRNNSRFQQLLTDYAPRS